MKDTESYINVAELKRKIRAWFSYHETSKQVREDFFNIIKKLPVTAKGNLEVTLENSNVWISVKDRLPIGKINPITQDFELVICATTFGDVRAYGYGKAKGHDKAHFWFGVGIMDEYVTHWMPLPEPPESENAE